MGLYPSIKAIKKYPQHIAPDIELEILGPASSTLETVGTAAENEVRIALKKVSHEEVLPSTGTTGRSRRTPHFRTNCWFVTYHRSV